MTDVRTPRLTLRSWREADAAPFAAMCADPVVMEFFERPQTREEAAAAMARWQVHIDAKGFGFWAVEAPGVAPFIGVAGIGPVPFEAEFTPAIEVGWRLAPEFWGRGYAAEAGGAALAHGWGLGLYEIVAMINPANHRSRAVAERIGMVRDPSGDFDHPKVRPSSPARRHVLYRVKAPYRTAPSPAPA